MKKQCKIKLRLNEAINEKPLVVSEAFFQILNLMISIFAFSFLVAAVSAVASPTVTAQTSYACCEKLKDKDLFCQNTLQSSCDTKFAYAPTSCDSTSFCRLGCCYDSKEGTCAENTPRKVCELRSGTWDPKGDCNIPQCQKGCCVLGDQASLTTLVRCKKLASFYGLETDYRSAIISEPDCVAIAQAADRGACVIITGTETNCKITTRADCKGMTHNETAFHKGFLCSAEELGTPCARQHHTGCVEGKDEVYWFDSCGNAENIYDASKERSWNHGKILEKEKSCDPNDNNAKDPNCGNCNYYMGSMCGKQRTGIEPRATYGDYICRDLNCYKTYNGKDYKHGESWCVFDSEVGQGKDVVGSRHWRHLCVMGEELVEPCEDYRQSICVDGKVTSNETVFIEAACRPSRWRECLDYNTVSDASLKKKKCEANSDCYFTHIWKMDLCLPGYPPGFNLGTTTGGSVAATFCGAANMQCPVIYEKTLFKGWVCKENCDCEKPEWVKEMNKWCTALGDCGAYVNIAGEVTDDGYTLTENSRLDKAYLDSLAKPLNIVLKGAGGKITGRSITALATENTNNGIGRDSTGNDVNMWYNTQDQKWYLDEAYTQAVPSAWSTPAAPAQQSGSDLGGLASTAVAAAAPSILGGLGKGAGAKTTVEIADTVAGQPTHLTLETAGKMTLGKKIDMFMYNTIVSGPIIHAFAAYFATSKIVVGLFGLQGDAAKIVTNMGVVSATTVSALQSWAYHSAYGSYLTSQGVTASTASAVQLAAAENAGVTAATGGGGGGWAGKLLGGIMKPFAGMGPVMGPIIFSLVIMLVVSALMKILKIGETKTKLVTFTCLPWEPPTGGEDCEKCNGDPMKPCSTYRCQSLGASCSLLNEGTGNETCVWLNRDDTNAPTIKPWKDALTKDHSYKDVKPCPPGPGCWKILRDSAKDGCIKAFTPLMFGIETNEPAQCRVDTNHTSKFDDMQFFFGDNLYIYNHSMQMSLPAPAAINAQAASPELKNDGKYTLYIRCKDGNGNWNLGEMAMSFCVDPGPDTTPPMVMRTSVENGAPISYGASSVPLDIFLNEPSECKWSRTDQDYENMNNTFSCASNLEQMEGDMTYKCSTTLTKISDRVINTFYFRCKDQPWLAAVNESDRNVNKESYVFKLQGTIPLNITQVGPNGTIKGGAEPIPVVLTVDTVNGYSYGDATCYFSSEGYDRMVEFFTTGTSHHEQKLDLWVGDHRYYILCNDLAGNIDKNETKFRVELDKTPPLVIRFYQDAGMLKIITDEETECRYGIKDCNFDFLSATEMPFSNSTEHTAEWRTDVTYYIKCKDQYGNMPLPSACSIQLNAYDIETTGE